jgi:hypothetical protein
LEDNPLFQYFKDSLEGKRIHAEGKLKGRAGGMDGLIGKEWYAGHASGLSALPDLVEDVRRKIQEHQQENP